MSKAELNKPRVSGGPILSVSKTDDRGEAINGNNRNPIQPTI